MVPAVRQAGIDSITLDGYGLRRRATPVSDVLLAAAERALPIAVFLIMIAVVAELSDRAGVFTQVARWVALAGRGRLWALWLLFTVAAALCTILLSLDTTAVLLTPVALALARQIKAPPRLFALTTLWVANVGSLLLPVSNLSNLLAMDRFAAFGLRTADYIRLAAAPAVASLVTALAIIAVLHRRQLASRYGPVAPAPRQDAALLWVSMAVCALIGPAFAFGLPPWAVATVAAAVLLTARVLRSRLLLRGVPVPWVAVLTFTALTAAVAAAHAAGYLDWLTSWAGTGTDAGGLLRSAGVAAATANVIDNLPAYLALEPGAGGASSLMATLIGTNAGPLITPWASIATILWLQRCRAAGVTWSWPRLGALGALCAAASVTAGTLALAAAG